VPEELTSQSAPHFSGSGIRVQVDDQNAETAKQLLEEAEAPSALDEDDESPALEDGEKEPA
jgi:hypothetical protein